MRALAREGAKLVAKIGETQARARDRSRAMGRRLRAISRTIRRHSGEAKFEVLKLTPQTGELVDLWVLIRLVHEGADRDDQKLLEPTIRSIPDRAARAERRGAGAVPRPPYDNRDAREPSPSTS